MAEFISTAAGNAHTGNYSQAVNPSRTGRTHLTDAPRECRLLAGLLLLPAETQLPLLLELDEALFSETLRRKLCSVLRGLASEYSPLRVEQVEDYLYLRLKPNESQKLQALLQEITLLYQPEENSLVATDLSVLKELLYVRKLEKLALNISTSIVERHSATQIIEQITVNILSLSAHAPVISFPKQVSNSYDEILLYQHQPPPVLLTGITELDAAISLRGSRYVGITAKSGIGKSIFSIDLTKRFFKYNTMVAVLYISMEINENDLMNGFYSNMCSIVKHRLEGRNDEKIPKLDATELAHLKAASEQMKKWPMETVCRSLTAEEIATYGRMFKARYPGYHIVLMVDHHLLVRSSGKYDNPRQDVIHLSETLKNLTMQLDSTTFLLCQLLDSVPDKDKEGNAIEPEFKIQESASIKQDIDIGLMIYRPAVIEKSFGESDTAYLMLAKNRGGQPGLTLPVTCVPKYGQFFSPGEKRAKASQAYLF